MGLSPVHSSVVVNDAVFNSGDDMMDNPPVGDTVPSQVLGYVTS